MQSERQRVAAQARAEGAEASRQIRADAERERTVLLAEARATADQLRGEGEAEATAHLRQGVQPGSGLLLRLAHPAGLPGCFDTGRRLAWC